MLHPKNYLESCTALLGYKDVIDHDPGYVSPHKIDKSGLGDKLEKLYRWERYFEFRHHVSMSYDGDVTSFVVTRTPSDWIELAFEGDIYSDDMECG